MTVKRDHLREMQAKFAHEMDIFVREHIDDENLFDFWLMEGVPDGADEDYLYDLFECPTCWPNICECFASICRKAGLLPSEESEVK